MVTPKARTTATDRKPAHPRPTPDAYRKFGGSHLKRPGASGAFVLYGHQKLGIWRIIADGSTYLAHAVGAGKTMTMAAAIMEQRRFGLIAKAMLVVPGHCLAQAAREFLAL